MVAQQGPNGTVTYNAVPQFQAVSVDGSQGDANTIQGQSIINNQQNQNMQNLQGIPIMTANGQIIRSQIPSIGGIMPANVAFAGGNMVNLGGNVLNLGGIQSVGAIRPGGIIQPLQLQPNIAQQIQQLPSFVQIPVSNNGQTTLMPVQMAQIQGNQDTNAGTTAAASVNNQTIVTGSGGPQIVEVFSHQTPKSQGQQWKSQSNVNNTSTVSTSTSSTTSPTVLSMTQLQNSSLPGQTIAAAAAAANIIPQVQLIPVGGGNYMQALYTGSTPNMSGGQNTLSIGSIQSSGTLTTTTTNTTSTISSPQQSTVATVVNPQILQNFNGQNFANLQIAGQNQIVASSNQVLSGMNLTNMKNMQFPVQIQNLQGLQAVQNIQGLQNLQGLQALSPQQINGQVQQVFGSPVPISGIQGISVINASGNVTTIGGQPAQVATVNLNNPQGVQHIQQIQTVGNTAQILTGWFLFTLTTKY